MAKFYAFKTIDVGSVSAGGTQEKEWTSDDDYIIHKIYVVEKSGQTLYQYEVTITLDGYAVTKDVVPASILAPDSLFSPTLDIELGKDRVIKFSVENGESASRDCYIVMELWK